MPYIEILWEGRRSKPSGTSQCCELVEYMNDSSLRLTFERLVETFESPFHYTSRICCPTRELDH